MMAARESWSPGCSVASVSRRAAMLKRARDHFAEHGVLEVDTPILSRYAVSDPHIDSVPVALQSDPGGARFLQTSPEYSMKRMLCARYPDIYQICKVFRDGEAGRLHQPEFTMLEWYRLDFGLKDIMRDAVVLIAALVDSGRLAGPPVYLSYRQAFLEYAGIDPLTADPVALARAAGADETLGRSLGQRRDAWLDLILSERVTRRFAPDRLTVLHHYPASQAALARICPNDDAVADRFEVFAGPLEFANGYVELTDPAEQLRRFETDRSLRTEAGKAANPIDTALIAALQSGLPACAGVAVGFDRVHMWNEGASDIRQVLCFAFEAPGDG